MVRFRTLTCTAMVAVGLIDLPLEAQAGPAAARARAETFVRSLDRGEFAAAVAMVGPQMKAAGVTEAMLGTIWAQLSGGVRLDTLRLHAQTSSQGYQLVDLAARFGTREQGLRVAVNDAGQVEGFVQVSLQPVAYRAPAYADTSAFEEVEVSVGAEGWPLGATLTLPRGVTRAPVVVLVHGSGSHDRDETVGQNRPFKDLAWGLATQGVAVLRYEKRTWKHGARIQVDTSFTIDDETIHDALAALAQVRTHARIDPARVYLLGHSLGGMVAPEIAVRDGQLAGVILMAGSPRRLTELVIEQVDYLKTLPMNATPAAQEQLAGMRSTMERLERRELAPAEDAGGAPASYFYDLAGRGAGNFVRRLTVPILVLHGGRDYQVTDTDYAQWQQLLAGRGNVQFERYADLNHLFATGSGRATPAEYMVRAGYVDERVIADIAAFVHPK